jgi:hypothetical protein
VRGVLLRAQFVGESDFPGYDFSNGWSGLFGGGLEIVDAVGDHLSMLRSANIVRVAGQLDGVLEKFDRTESHQAGLANSRERVFG